MRKDLNHEGKNNSFLCSVLHVILTMNLISSSCSSKHREASSRASFLNLCSCHLSPIVSSGFSGCCTDYVSTKHRSGWTAFVQNHTNLISLKNSCVQFCVCSSQLFLLTFPTGRMYSRAWNRTQRMTKPRAWASQKESRGGRGGGKLDKLGSPNFT